MDSFGRKLVSIGNYRLTGCSLGEGSFGKVELAYHTKTKTKVALKVIFKAEIRDPYVMRNISREAFILLSLNHPNIVRLVEVCHTSLLFCLCIEYIEGRTLWDELRCKGRFHEYQAKGICGQLIGAIHYIHKRGILHRDLKLENVMLSRNRVVLLDFGLSTHWSPNRNMNTFCGSPEYAAPELYRKDHAYGPGVDIWSFGIILYALTIGKLPFNLDQRAGAATKEPSLGPLISKIANGMQTSYQIWELSNVSILCRTLIKRCLDLNPATRATAYFIMNDPWILVGNPLDHLITSSGRIIQRESVSKSLWRVREALKCSTSSINHIACYIKQRPFGTTAGLYRLYEMSSETARQRTPFKDLTNCAELGPNVKVLGSAPKKYNIANNELGVTKTRSILKKSTLHCSQKKTVRFEVYGDKRLNQTMTLPCNQRRLQCNSILQTEDSKKIYIR